MNSIRFSAFALVTLVLASPVTGKADEACDPIDQLKCACTNAGSEPVNLTVSACFIGDLNTPTTTLVDNLSAQAFSALNWPVAIDEHGMAKAGVPNFAGLKCEQDDVTLCGDYATVWETWKSTNQMFRQGPPPAWDSFDQQLPAACSELDVQSEIAAQIKSHSPWAEIPTAFPPRLLDEYTNPEGHALLDENGVPVRFDISFNKNAYDYTVDNNLWSPRGLEAFLRSDDSLGKVETGKIIEDEHGAKVMETVDAHRLTLPIGKWSPQERGAIIVKSSWKVMDEDDDPSRFHKSWAFVSPIIENGELRHDCAIKPVGLVGMHIAYKTGQMPTWAWSTFEHIHAAPPWAAVGASKGALFSNGEPVPDWLFYQSAAKRAADPRGKKGVVAKLNAIPKNALTNVPTRITEFYPPGYYSQPKSVTAGAPYSCINDGQNTGQNFECQNERLADGFQHSVFKNYRLKGTQWRDDKNDFRMVPPVLSNVTLETYTQATASCRDCHKYAKPNPSNAGIDTFDSIFSFGRDVLQLSTPSQSLK